MLISDFTIMCDDCGRRYRIPSDSLDVDYACSERPMGTEEMYRRGQAPEIFHKENLKVL